MKVRRLPTLLTVSLLAALGLFLSLSTSTAAPPPPPGEEELFELADDVIEGQVVQITSAWNKEHTTIQTAVSIDISSRLKGNLAGQVTIMHGGGEVGDTGLYVSTEPQFASGEQVRLYLYRRDDNSLGVLWGTDGKISLSGTPIEPFYVYSGIRWNDSDIPVPYYVHQAGSSRVSDGSEFAAARASFQAWNNVACSYFQFNYQGTTPYAPSTNNVWDDRNVVGWMAKASWGAGVPPSALAVNQYWYSTYNYELIEFDVTFFEEWDWSTDSDSGIVDLQSVGTHEAGHALSLDHSGNSSAVMYWSYTLGTIKRTLHQDDINGICDIYPEPFGVSPTTLTFFQDVDTDIIFPATSSLAIKGHNESWTSTDNRSWIDRAPTSGTAPDSLGVSLSGTSAFALGTYTGTVTITDTTESSAYTAIVQLHVVPEVYSTYLPLVMRNAP